MPRNSHHRKFALKKTMNRVRNHHRTTGDTTTVTNITSTAFEMYDNTIQNAYMHPSLRDSKPIIWIARDSFGIAADEVQRTQASSLNVLMSIDGARFNEKMNIEISSPPRDHTKASDRNNI